MLDPITDEGARKHQVFALLGCLYAKLICRHRGIAAVVVVVFAAILGQTFWFGKLPQRLAYCGAIAFSVWRWTS
jgi:hypothetical protein